MATAYDTYEIVDFQDIYPDLRIKFTLPTITWDTTLDHLLQRYLFDRSTSNASLVKEMSCSRLGS